MSLPPPPDAVQALTDAFTERRIVPSRVSPTDPATLLLRHDGTEWQITYYVTVRERGHLWRVKRIGARYSMTLLTHEVAERIAPPKPVAEKKEVLPPVFDEAKLRATLAKEVPDVDQVEAVEDRGVLLGLVFNRTSQPHDFQCMFTDATRSLLDGDADHLGAVIALVRHHRN
ncbi:hypothetical protein [Streptomyces albidoflavus]|uniref:hypothetical protein n=1 Tax=Streptomyces albidoflavus TaxID=1886 RepID=UPI0033C46898